MRITRAFLLPTYQEEYQEAQTVRRIFSTSALDLCLSASDGRPDLVLVYGIRRPESAHTCTTIVYYSSEQQTPP
jgi:hypothetical protein